MFCFYFGLMTAPHTPCAGDEGMFRFYFGLMTAPHTSCAGDEGMFRFYFWLMTAPHTPCAGDEGMFCLYFGHERAARMHRLCTRVISLLLDLPPLKKHLGFNSSTSLERQTEVGILRESKYVCAACFSANCTCVCLCMCVCMRVFVLLSEFVCVCGRACVWFLPTFVSFT